MRLRLTRQGPKGTVARGSNAHYNREKSMKRVLSVIFASLVITLALPLSAYAQATTDPISSGLWTGSNLMLESPNLGGKKSKVYAALGDSVAAGIGLPTPTGNDARCGTTKQAYAYSIAKSTKLSLIHAACSGATVGDLFTKQRLDGPNIAPQLDTAFAKGTPRLITLTAGANDAHWAEFVKKCYAMACGTASDTKIANSFLSALQLKLYYMFYSIQSRSGGTPPPVVVTGYYNPVSERCTSAQMTASEIAWLTAEQKALNQTIQNVTKQFSFATYVPIDFTGHDICSTAPWVQRLDGAAPFHPTTDGQKAMARAIKAVL